jgi:hypothetical protein
LLADKVAGNWIDIRVTQGLRSWAEQTALYEQGRTKPGPIVTKARPGYSAHNFGYAVDIVPDTEEFPTFTPDWNELDVRWKQILLLAKACGLEEGAMWRTFPDYPHLYLGELPANPTDLMRALFAEGGLEKLWASWKFDQTEPEVSIEKP